MFSAGFDSLCLTSPPSVFISPSPETAFLIGRIISLLRGSFQTLQRVLCQPHQGPESSGERYGQCCNRTGANLFSLGSVVLVCTESPFAFPLPNLG
uniref:Uncharacterized protein n=1 Tax=Anguilla anguilla TaxID=7936 RepID=A0A0E9RJL2_ANGAN